MWNEQFRKIVNSQVRNMKAWLDHKRNTHNISSTSFNTTFFFNERQSRNLSKLWIIHTAPITWNSALTSSLNSLNLFLLKNCQLKKNCSCCFSFATYYATCWTLFLHSKKIFYPTFCYKAHFLFDKNFFHSPTIFVRKKGKIRTYFLFMILKTDLKLRQPVCVFSCGITNSVAVFLLREKTFSWLLWTFFGSCRIKTRCFKRVIKLDVTSKTFHPLFFLAKKSFFL